MNTPTRSYSSWITRKYPACAGNSRPAVFARRREPGRRVAPGGGSGKYWSSMRFKKRSDSPLKKKIRRGFRGYPVASVAFYGPDDERASKVAVCIVTEEGAEPAEVQRWFSEAGDVRADLAIGGEILQFIQSHGVLSVVATNRIIGCPHEEGKDYLDGQVCPQCPFWANRDRWTGEIIH